MSRLVDDDVLEANWRAIDDHLRQRAFWRKVSRWSLVAFYVAAFIVGGVMWWLGWQEAVPSPG